MKLYMVVNMNNFEKLQEQVLTNSESNDWDNAIKEWKCKDIYIIPNGVCACGHYPIKQVCLMENINTMKQ